MPDDWDAGNVLKFIFIGFVVLSWIGSQVVRVFLRTGEQRGRERPFPGRRAAGPAAGQQRRPADMGSFLEELRRRSDEQEREFQGQIVDEEQEENFDEEPLLWEPVPAEPARTPRRPLQGLAGREPDARTRIEARPTRSIAATVGRSTDARATDPSDSNLYSAPAHFSVPSWLSISDITQAKHVETILGVAPQKAILLSEIIGPPLALRKRPGGRHGS